MNKKLRIAILLISLVSTVSLFSQTIYYVATNGSDKNTGKSLSKPFATLSHAINVVSPGDTIFLRSGVYTISNTIDITNSGTADKHFTLSAYKPELTTAFNNNRPVLNYSVAFATAGSSERGVQLMADYWDINGIVIDYAGDNGMWVSGHHCNIRFCVFSHSRDAGLQLSGGASADTIINCDSYANADLGPGTTSNGGNADGFSVKLDIGDSIYMRGCRSWHNSDDGYDGYLRPSATSPQNNVTWTQEDCWSFRNGFYWLNDSTTSTMNGMGFKTGGSDTKNLAHNCYMKKCLSFYNKGNGFDQNSNAGTIAMYNCTSYGNHGSSIYMASPIADSNYYPGAQLILENDLSIGGRVSTPNLSARPLTAVTNLYTTSDSNSEILSFDTTGVSGARGIDGSLPVISFMHLNTAATQPFTMIDQGTVLDTILYHDSLGIPYIGAAPDLGCFESDYMIPTPVRLISFTASAQKDAVLLNWSTASEINNKGYGIERTTDPAAGVWTSIGFVDGHGSDNQRSGYSYTDKAVSSGIYYYRLKQLDMDGTATYSNVLSVNLQSADLQLSASPNPFSTSTTISYTLTQNEKVSLYLYDMSGELVDIILNENQQAGTYHKVVAKQALPAGEYYLGLSVGDKKSGIGLIKK